MIGDFVAVAITSGLAGMIFKTLFDYIVSRRFKSVDLSQKYLKLADMSVDQLEERINLIGKLDTDNRRLTHEVEELKAKRAERDEQLEAMEAGIAAMREQVNKWEAKYTELETKYSIAIREKDKLMSDVRMYLSKLLNYFEGREISDYPVPPEDLLDTQNKIRLKGKGKS